ncbi:MAG: NYN domain-containing protein [Dehalococcoidia bacterium]
MAGSAVERKSRVAVFIDGSNLHHRLQECGWPTRVDIRAFSERLVGSRGLVQAYYYNVPPPRTLRPEQVAGQERYYSLIRGLELVRFRLGHLQERRVPGGVVFEEKGVDVTLAIDMLTGAFEDRYDSAVLVSSDGDFAPLVREVQRYGKRVEYVYFRGGRLSRALQQACNVSRQCRRSWVVQFER